jgi:hypothetical protein
MRKNLGTMIVVCGLAALACTPASLACDKEKNVAQSGADRAAAAKVVQVKSTCSKSRKASAATVTAAGKAACGSKTGKAVTVQAAAGGTACPAETVMKQLVQALSTMNDCCGAECGARASVVKAVRTMAAAKPELACEKVTKLLACEVKGDSARTVVVGAGTAACCPKTGKAVAVQVDAGKAVCDPAACATKAKVLAAGGKFACDPSNCDPSKCSKNAKVIAAGGKACGTAASARYVAYDCKKTDHMARAIAHAYVNLMRELKVSTGADGCAATTAKKVLASVLDEMQAERAAAAPAVETTEGVAEIETVSFGVVSEDAKASKRTCGSSRN